MESNGRKRKSYAAYKFRANGNKTRSKLEPGLRGFLCTCNFKEKDCIRESFNILNEYIDCHEAKNTQVAVQPDVSPDVGTVEDSVAGVIQINKDMGSLKSEPSKPLVKRFQLVDSGAKNCLFIRTTIEEPVKLVHMILNDLEITKKRKTCFLLRLLPIEVTCKPYIDDIKEKADPLFEKYFTAEGKSFSILFNCRGNGDISRDKVIEKLASMVIRKNPANHVDLKQPELVVLVEVILNVCCISVLPDYFRFRKYNLLEVSGGIERKGIKAAPTADGGPATAPDEDKTAAPAQEEDTADASIEEIEPPKKAKEDFSVEDTTYKN